jgi:queuine tRNA-ribosyltransferase
MRSIIIKTAHGDIQTPFFMPIATKGAVKTLSSFDVERLGSPIVLSNAYHLFLRPGIKVIERLGGLHKFMGWNGAILTDSGGFQVFSLSDRRKVTEEGVVFRSPIDGSEHALTPESSIDIQMRLGSDIIMCFDEVIGLPASEQETASADERTGRWAKRCREYFDSKIDSSINPNAQLFGILQGGTNHELRKRSAQELLKTGFDGYAIGGLSVGEPFEEALGVLDQVIPLLPKDKPRYFMGGAQPDQIIEYVKRGIDMFDCVLPTRNARHGHLYRWVHDDLSKPDFYEVINVTNAACRGSSEPLLNASASVFDDELSRFSLGYLHHLFDTQEMLAYRLATIHNVAFYLRMFELIREGKIRM